MDGIASHLETLLPALQRQGWESHVLAGFVDAPSETHTRLERIKGFATSFTVNEVLYSGGARSPRKVFQQSSVIKSHARRCAANIIHLQGRALGPPSYLASLGTPTRVVNTCQLALSKDDLKSRRTRLLGHFYGHRVIAISREVHETLTRGWGVPTHRVRPVYHGVDVDYYSPPSEAERLHARSSLGVPHDAFVVVQIARVSAIKRPRTIVEAVLQLRSQGYNCVGLLAGYADEDQKHEITDLIKKHQAQPYIRLLGHADTKTVLHGADCKVLASEREGFPISIIEAMACGVVPIRTPVDGAYEQIEDGVNGFLFPLGDSEALSNRLRDLLQDPVLRRKTSENARSTAVTRLSADSMARNTIAVYEELL
jgi:glycosyltransferase involved in cell wall biosynthesis